MADDRIDIVVTDKGADKAASNIRRIGTEAEKSSLYVERLKVQLAAVNGTATQRLAAASQLNSTTILKESAAQDRLTAAQARAQRAAAALATSQTEVARKTAAATAALETEAAAQARISAMVEASLAKQAAASAPAVGGGRIGGVTGSRALAAAQMAQMASSAPMAMKAIRDTEAAAAALGKNTPGFFAAFKNSATGAFDTIRDFVTGNGARFRGTAKEVEAGLAGVAAAAASGTPHIKGNSTAMREMLVLLREGSRGDMTRMAGSASILASALGLMEAVVIPLVIVLGTLAAGMKAFQMSISSDVNPQLQAYAQTLGLTTKEMRKLSDEHVNAKGKIEELNVVQVTMGDVFHGFIATVQEALSGFGDNVKNALDSMGVNWSSVWGSIKKWTYAAVVGIAASIQTLAEIVAKTFINMGKIIYNAFVLVVNIVTGTIKLAVNTAIDGINWLSQKSNQIFHTNFGQIDHMKQGADTLFDGMLKFSKLNDSIGKTFGKNAKTIDKTLTGFGDRWKANTLTAGENRLNSLADAIKSNRNPKAPRKARTSDPKTQSDFINDENKKLDDQLRRMNMLKDAREVQEKLDAIEEAFMKRRMPLDAAQLQAFKDKIVAVQQGSRQQAIMDSIYEESTGALQKYNDTLAVANRMLAAHQISQQEAALAINNAARAVEAQKDLIGANAAKRAYGEATDKIAVSLAREGITQEQATQQTNIAARAYASATDPLFQMKEAMDSAEIASKLYGNQVQAQTYYEQLRQAELAKGIVLDATWTQGQNAAVDALMRRNAALQQSTLVQSQLDAVLKPITDAQDQVASQAAVYAELQRLRDADKINEEAYQQAKHALWVKYNEANLNATADFFGALAKVTAHGHGVIGAISKAAAVAQALIQGFVAAQNALASAPPPFNFIEAAAVGLMTAANVASILSTNVGNFKDGGQFMVAGRSGIDANNINMNVTKGERVTIETAKQQRANDNSSAATPEVNVPVKVVNIHDKSSFHAAMADEEGVRVILNVIKDNPSTVQAVAGAGR